MITVLEFVPCSEAMEQSTGITKTTWAYRKKRKPAGEINCQSWLCIRVDLQKVDYTSDGIFTPVVEWATIQMFFYLFVMKKGKGCKTTRDKATRVANTTLVKKTAAAATRQYYNKTAAVQTVCAV